MNNEDVHYVGKRIKEIRLQKEMKLVDLAIKSGISKGLLSRIENGRTIPSLPVLFNIITTLNENPSSFFETMGQGSNSPFYMLLKKEEYSAIEKEDSVGFNYFSIFSRSFSDFTFNAVLLLLEPDAKREMVTTDGMEFIYLASGNIEYKLGDETISMEEGDSLFFDGRVPHLKINNSEQTARILVIYLLFNK
ncbi:helix-turn-helix domain-containing protein [Mangrovibacterium diazotrophicum]|nr:XRE family transcriptional regulator [Mangrovibacterium diazotrophicum]